MLPRPIHLRRARRTDFNAIWALLTTSGMADGNGTDRATLRRYRRIVGDLGADLYVAETDGRPLGLVHVTYARRLAEAPEARLELLLVDQAAEREGLEVEMAVFAAARARRRGCAALRFAAPSARTRGALEDLGWRGIGEVLEFDLAGRAQ